MQRTKNITLINPPWFFAYKREAIMSQNIGLGYLASYLEKNNHEVFIIDALAEGFSNQKKVKSKYQQFIRVGLDYDQIVEKIPLGTDYIGISAPFTNNAKIAKKLAAKIKNKFPNIPLILGGVYPSLNPLDAICPEIDYYIIGEGEIPLLEILNGIDPGQIQGVMSSGNKKHNLSYAKIIENLDDIPFPARDKLPMDKYLSFCSPRRHRLKTASIITSRGCPYDCTFCSIHAVTGYKWRTRSADNVIAEIKVLIKDYGIEHIEFEDDNLTLDKKRIKEIISGITKINEQGGNISWSVPNGVRVDSLDLELLGDIKNSRCLGLNLAVESGDPVILKKMNKRLNLDKVIEVAGICQRLGIHMTAFFMIGYPGETKESFNKTISFVKKLKKLGVDQFYATITRAYPGTKLFDDCIANGFMENIQDRDNIFLGNTIHRENAIITDDFNTKDLLERFALFERVTVPFYLRWYHRNYHIIKKMIPDSFIQKLKKLGKNDIK